MVYILLGEGFEEIEAIAVGDVLRRGEVECQYVSIGDPVVTGRSNISVTADKRLYELSIKQGDCIVIPGGLGGVEAMEQSLDAGGIIKRAAEMKLMLAAICAGPRFLAMHGALEGKNITCYPGMESQMKGAASVDCKKSTVVDGNLITGRAPGAAIDFALEVLAQIKGQEKADEVRSDLVYG